MPTTIPDMNSARRSPIESDREKLLELASVIDRKLPVFHRIALRRLNNVADAEDAVQDALLAAYTHLRQFRSQAQLSTWLTSIVINSARMKLRRRQRRILLQLGGQEQDESTLTESLIDSRPNPEQNCRHRELSQLVDRSVRRLSPSMRKTLHLRTIHGLSIRETAYLLEVPIGTVKAQLARARRKLKEMMRICLT